jgi:hypothetical protein
MTNDRLIDKIKKLLALASDPAAAPQEAETAARQAAYLMAQNDLDLADLEAVQLAAQWDMTTATAQGCRPGKKDAVEVPPWIGIIAWGVKIFTRTRATNGRGTVTFKGPREDVVLAVWLHEYLLHQAYAASRGLGLREANQFRNGFASALQGRLKKLAAARGEADQAVAGGTGGTALVKVQDSRRFEMDKFFGPESKSKSSGVKTSIDGYLAGQKAAIPTNRPLAGSSNRLLS